MQADLDRIGTLGLPLPGGRRQKMFTIYAWSGYWPRISLNCFQRGARWPSTSREDQRSPRSVKRPRQSVR